MFNKIKIADLVSGITALVIFITMLFVGMIFIIATASTMSMIIGILLVITSFHVSTAIFKFMYFGLFRVHN